MNRRVSDEAVLVHIKTIHVEVKEEYGWPRMWKELLVRGIRVGKERVRKLMQRHGIKARGKRKFVVTTDSKHNLPIAPNFLERNFTPERPNQVWTSDITYIGTDEGWLYLTAVIDLFSRQVVGWSMKTHIVTDALRMAWFRRRPAPGLVFHSDRGSQYTSEQFQRLLGELGVTCSMSRAGNVWDNSAMESFFSSLKTERTARKVYRTRQDARADVFDYIERFYNPTRRHSTIGYVSPVAFEKAQLA